MNQSNYIFGIHALGEALDAGKELDKVLIKKGISGAAALELVKKLRDRNIPIQYVPVEKLNRVTRKNHQGVVAWISPVTYQDISEVVTSCFEQGRTPCIMVLDEITDTRNFGAIARTAECAGFDAIVIPLKGAAPITPDAMKTSAGALLKIPVCRVNNLTKTVQLLQHYGLKIVAASEKADKNYRDISYTEPLALIMGSEEKGVNIEILKICDERVSIPMLGTLGSLNVSVAAGILSYEVVHQRQN